MRKRIKWNNLVESKKSLSLSTHILYGSSRLGTMDYLPGQYGMHYERIGLNDYHFDSLGLTGHRPYYAFAGNQLATGEQGSNGNYYWMQQQHSGQHLVGQKQYELTNHLGNVQVTVSDLPYKHGNDTMTHISPALKAVYDYYPFGSPMPGRTIMDTARKCVDMTRLDRVWRAWEMTQTEIYAFSLINYHLDGEGEVFIDDNGAVEVEIADEHAVFYMDLQDSLNNGGEMVLHVDWLKEFSEKGFQLYVQGLDAAGEMRVFYQKHYENPEDVVYLSIADSYTNVSVGIQGALHFGISNIRYFGGSWVNEEVLVRVCDEVGDRYRFGFNGMLKDNEWAGMGTHLDFGARIYDSRVGRWLSVDPLAGNAPTWAPYNAMWNNPIRFVDPDGRWAVDHIDVTKNDDGTYNVVGGQANSDKNIYVVDGGGKRTGEVVGEMLTEYSFHHEDGSAVKGTNINLNDQSGQNFFNNEIKNVGLFDYIGNAKGGEPLDFKRDGTKPGDANYNNPQYHYRGMSFEGKIASARDIGNYAAGYVAGKHGFGWGSSRFAFDALQTKQEKGTWNTVLYYPFNRVREGQPTQQAERAGHNVGYPIFKQRQAEREWKKVTNPWPIGPKY